MLEDFKGDEEMANVREVTLNSGVKVKLNRIDPYGLIRIDFQGATTPEPLSGMYTGYDLARQAIEAWENANSKLIKKDEKKS